MTAFLSRLFRCLPFFLFVFATNALPSSTWGCDAQTQASIGYDGTWLPASGYDTAQMPLTGEKGSQIARTGGAFAVFAKFLAAEGEASLWTKGDYNGTTIYQRDNLIDPGLIDGAGRTNLERMNSGLAPIGPK
jgi:hypothetical protein